MTALNARIAHFATEATNPLIPHTWEWLAMVPLALVIALPIAAVISLAWDRHYTTTQRLLWLILIVIAPFIGPLLWFILGRTHMLTQHTMPANSQGRS